MHVLPDVVVCFVDSGVIYPTGTGGVGTSASVETSYVEGAVADGLDCVYSVKID